MALLIGGIGSSHAPSIAHAWDHDDRGRPEWTPLFQAYEPVKAWLQAQRVDTVVVFYNDHLNHFQFDAYPTFAIGVCETMPLCDEGAGRRPLPAFTGNVALGWHLASALVADEFDMTVCQEMELDHGVGSVLPLITSIPWGVRIVPININVLRDPMPTPRRCWRIGEAVGRAIRAYSGNERVVVAATGGLSHQLHGPDFGFTNPQWDQRFLELLVHEPQLLAQASHDDFVQRSGAEGAEVFMWLAMRGALAAAQVPLQEIQRFYWAPMLTGYGLLALQCAQG
jgi:protocatechuate 4,5-dioxygenase beta chain